MSKDNNAEKQLLRLHIIEAHIESKKELDTYVIVVIGLQSSKTDLVKNSANPKFNSHFAIEYTKQDEGSEIQLQLYEKGRLTDDKLGEWKIKLSDLDSPQKTDDSKKEDKEAKKKEKVDKKKEKEKQEPWANSKPKTAECKDKKGNKTAEIVARMRREAKMIGNLEVTVQDAVLVFNDNKDAKDKKADDKKADDKKADDKKADDKKADDKKADDKKADDKKAEEKKVDAKTNVKCVVKLMGDSKDSPNVVPKSVKNNSADFVWKPPFITKLEVSDKNNTFDIFIELWEVGATSKKGEARLTIYDCRKKFSSSLPLLSPSENNKEIGHVTVKAQFKK